MKVPRSKLEYMFVNVGDSAQERQRREYRQGAVGRDECHECELWQKDNRKNERGNYKMIVTAAVIYSLDKVTHHFSHLTAGGGRSDDKQQG